jgi:hypothetical protein
MSVVGFVPGLIFVVVCFGVGILVASLFIKRE